MSGANKDEMLANFQAVVPTVETAMALQMLEAVGWNLEEAINMALASQIDDDAAAPANGAVPVAVAPAQPEPAALSHSEAAEVGGTSDVGGVNPFAFLRDADDITAGASTSSNGLPRRLLSLNLHFRGRLLHLAEIPLTLSVRGLKHRIASDVCGLEGRAGDIHLTGWVPTDPDFEPPDDLQLSELGLSSGASLTARLDDDDDEGGDPDLLAATFKFSVQDLHAGGHLHNFALPGAQTLADLKTTTRSLTEIPVYRQSWVGFPAETAADTVLAAVAWQRRGESAEEIHLSVDVGEKVSKAAASHASPAKSSDPNGSIPMEDSDDDDVSYLGLDAPNASGSMEFLEESPSNAQAPLIPQGLGSSPMEAVANLTAVFESRFPSKLHPNFYQGTLGEAMAATSGMSGRERRPLAILLLNDAAVAGNIFCEQVLCSDQLTTLLDQNFILWPWDVSQAENAELLVTWANGALGGGGGMGEAGLPVGIRHGAAFARMRIEPMPMEANFVRHLIRIKDQAPFLIFLGKNRASWELLGQVKGSASASEALDEAMSAMEVQAGWAAAWAEERAEAESRAAFRGEQESEYEAIQAADREKAEERQRAELAAKAEEKRQRLAAEAVEVERATLESLVPPEPPADTQEPVAQLRIRCPDGEALNRRFRGSESVQVLLHFVAAKGYPADKFRLLTSFPKRDLSALEDLNQTLSELKLVGREQLTLDEK